MHCRRLNKMLKETDSYFDELAAIERNPKFSKKDREKLESLKSRLDILSEVISNINC